jgi:hypothetical protein
MNRGCEIFALGRIDIAGRETSLPGHVCRKADSPGNTSVTLRWEAGVCL